MPNKDKNSAEQELKEIAQIKGKKLAFFIASLNVSEEAKDAAISLLPGMSLEQIERFLDILEAKYLEQETESIDYDFKRELKKIKSEHQEKSSEIDSRAIEKIAELEKNLT